MIVFLLKINAQKGMSMNKLMYVCCVVISLGASMHCSSQDLKRSDSENARTAVVPYVIVALDLTAIKADAHAQKMKVGQQELPEKKIDCLELGQPLSISRGESFRSKVDVLHLS